MARAEDCYGLLRGLQDGSGTALSCGAPWLYFLVQRACWSHSSAVVIFAAVMLACLD
jgi:hypothetical protein